MKPWLLLALLPLIGLPACAESSESPVTPTESRKEGAPDRSQEVAPENLEVVEEQAPPPSSEEEASEPPPGDVSLAEVRYYEVAST